MSLGNRSAPGNVLVSKPKTVELLRASVLVSVFDRKSLKQ